METASPEPTNAADRERSAGEDRDLRLETGGPAGPGHDAVAGRCGPEVVGEVSEATTRRRAEGVVGGSTAPSAPPGGSRRRSPRARAAAPRRPGSPARDAGDPPGPRRQRRSSRPSSTATRSCGCARRSAITAAGTIVASALGKAPMRSSRCSRPRCPPAAGPRAGGARRRRWRARAAARPPGVTFSSPRPRSSRRVPACRSSAATCCETADCVSDNASPARENDPCSATSRKVSTRRGSSISTAYALSEFLFAVMACATILWPWTQERLGTTSTSAPSASAAGRSAARSGAPARPRLGRRRRRPVGRGIRRGLELGVTFFDTADVYGTGHSEKSSAARSAPTATGRDRDEVRQHLRGGHGPDAPAPTLPRLHPARVRGIAAPAGHRPHRPLPVPRRRPRAAAADEVAGTLEQLRAEGLIRAYGWSIDDPERAALVGRPRRLRGGPAPPQRARGRAGDARAVRARTSSRASTAPRWRWAC